MQFPANIFQSICEQILPTACVICQEFQKNTVCNTCLERLREEGLFNYQCCYQCGIALQIAEIEQQCCVSCQANRPQFDETYCLDRYEGVLQAPLYELKYQKRISYAHALAELWNKTLAKQLEVMCADYLFPVPLSIQKLAQRGFNQSWEISKRIRCNPSIHKSPHILRRHHYSEHQAGSSLHKRYLSTQGMFYVETIDIERLQNKTIIVFDDVMTSGATLNEIARVLKDNGVSRVINWVVLRAKRPT